MSVHATWPPGLPMTQVRIARPTDKLDGVVRFYATDLGLPELERFAGHAGYEGVMLGLRGTGHHLEVIAHATAPRVRHRPRRTCWCRRREDRAVHQGPRRARPATRVDTPQGYSDAKRVTIQRRPGRL
jgi:hypothetical protein